MPDITELIEQTLIRPINAFLAEHPEGVGEVESLSAYYLASATESSVSDLHDAFWIKYLKNENAVMH